MLQTVLSSIILIGLGVIGGFALFHYALQDRLQKTEHGHNATLSIVRGQLLESEAERTRCTEQDDGRLQEMSELRGRLDAQYKNWYDLTASQRLLATRHQEVVLEAGDLRGRLESDEAALRELTTRLEEKDRDLFATRGDVKEMEAAMEQLRSRLGQKDRNLTAVEKELVFNRQTRVKLQTELTKMREVADQKAELEKETEEMRALIRQYDDALEGAQNDSESLLVQKKDLEKEVAGLKANIGEMQLQIDTKDKELTEYREEEGNLETKLNNLREGMIGLLKEKINEIQDLKNRIENLNKEKAELEVRLDNWRDGMLALVKDKMEAIEKLKQELAHSQQEVDKAMNEIERARSGQNQAEELVRDKQHSIDEANPEEDGETIAELKEIIERMNRDLEENRNWVEAATRDIEQRKLYQVEAEKQLSERNTEIAELESKMNEDQESAREMISRLESDLEEARKLVEEKTLQIEGLNAQLSEFLTEFKELRSSLPGGKAALESSTSDIIIDHVQQRDGVICRQLFGKGPYYVRFNIRLPPNEGSEGEENAAMFVIELPSRKQLPHSTYALLTLVESNLYTDGAAFLFAEEFGLQIKSSLSSGGKSLENKLKPLGLTGGSSLSFLETSTSGEPMACDEFSLGFDRRGPGLNLFLSDSGNDTGECFAKVIRGQDKLPEIKSLLLERGEPLEIVSATHLRVD